MKLGTKDIIKILPFEDSFKKDLLDKYDFLDDDQKYNIQTIVWDIYNWIFDTRLQENINVAMDMAIKGQEKLDNKFYARINELTEKEFATGNLQSVDEVDLSTTRDKLQEILSKLEREEE